MGWGGHAMATATCRSNGERDSTRPRSSIGSSSAVPWSANRADPGLGEGSVANTGHADGVERADKDGFLRNEAAPSPAHAVLSVGGRDPSTVEVAAPSPAVGLGSEWSLKLHQAPDSGAVGAEVWLDLAASRRLARSTPSSSAHRSSGAAIGRPRPGSCHVPTNPGYRTRFETPSTFLRTAARSSSSANPA
jgi:hypothetical protein